MRIIARWILILAVPTLLLWFGAEYMLLRGVRNLAHDGYTQVGQSAMLVDPARIGARFNDLDLALEGGTDLHLSQLALWVAPWALNNIRADLPPRLVMQGVYGKQDFRIIDGGLHARFSPLRKLALQDAGLHLEALQLNGEPVSQSIRLDLALSGYGPEIPRDSRAAYRLNADMNGLNLPLLTRLTQIGEATGNSPGDGRISGPATLWLTHALRLGADTPPEIVGVTFQGLRMTIDDAEMRIWGQIDRGAEGKADGLIVLDSPDLRDFVIKLADAGFFPPEYSHLTASALETAADHLAATSTDARINETDVVALRANEGNPHIPKLPEGQRRVPVRLEAGQIHIGDLALGAFLQGAANDPDLPAMPDAD